MKSEKGLVQRSIREGGFTLIELLVVIAIIGILASVVLASLSSARNKGKDAAVKSNLATARVQAQMYYEIYSKYRNPTASGAFTSTDCATATSVFKDITGTAEAQSTASVVYQSIIAAYSAGGSSGLQCKMDDTNEKYLIAVKMNSGNYWCVDSAGTAKDIGASLPGALVYVCS